MNSKKEPAAYRKAFALGVSGAAFSLLTGCAHLFDARPVPLTEKPLIYREALIRIVDPQFDFPNPHQLGAADLFIRNGMRVCDIYLRDYPRLLGHETDHCFRDHWHSPLKPNADDFE